MKYKLDDLVRHSSDRSPFVVDGIRKNELEIRGDFSGGTHDIQQTSWVDIKSVMPYEMYRAVSGMSRKEEPHPEINGTIIISAFPGTGKTTYEGGDYHPANWSLDRDSSGFSRDNFPNNYMTDIISRLGYYRILFISSHKEVRSALNLLGIPFTLVYPDVSLKDEYITRYKTRGNKQQFIDLLNENWEAWINELQSQSGCKHVVLQSNQFIANIKGLR